MSFSCMKCGMLTPTGDDEEFCSDHALNAFAEGRKQGVAEERVRICAWLRKDAGWVLSAVSEQGGVDRDDVADAIERGEHMPKAVE